MGRAELLLLYRFFRSCQKSVLFHLCPQSRLLSHCPCRLPFHCATPTPYRSAASRQLTPYFTISKRFIVPPFLRKKRRPARLGASRRLRLILCCFRFFFVLSFSQGFLPRALSLDLCLITAIVTAVFDICPRCCKHPAAVFAGTLPAAALCRLLPVEF